MLQPPPLPGTPTGWFRNAAADCKPKRMLRQPIISAAASVHFVCTSGSMPGDIADAHASGIGQHQMVIKLSSVRPCVGRKPRTLHCQNMLQQYCTDISLSCGGASPHRAHELLGGPRLQDGLDVALVHAIRLQYNTM